MTIKPQWMDDYKVHLNRGWHIITPGTEMQQHWHLRDMQAKAFEGMKVHECPIVPARQRKDTFWNGCADHLF